MKIHRHAPWRNKNDVRRSSRIPCLLFAKYPLKAAYHRVGRIGMITSIAASKNWSSPYALTMRCGRLASEMSASLSSSQKKNCSKQGYYQWQMYQDNYGLGVGSSLVITHPVYGQGDTILPITAKLKQTQYQGGLHGQDEIQAGRFTFVAGGRGDFTAQSTVNSLTGVTTASQNPDAFTGHTGVSYHVSGLAPYFSYSTSFLPTLGAGYNGNAFAPTRGSNMEGGVKYQLPGSPFMLRVAGFSTTEQNVAIADPNHPGFSIQTGKVHTPGAEVQLNGTHKHLDFAAAFTHIHPVNTESTTYLNDQPALVASNTASSWLHYAITEPRISGLGIGAGVRFVGRSWGAANNSFEVANFTVFDGVLDYTRERWRFAVNAKNIGNRKYVDGCYSNAECAFGAARTVFGSTTITF